MQLCSAHDWKSSDWIDWKGAKPVGRYHGSFKGRKRELREAAEESTNEIEDG